MSEEKVVTTPLNKDFDKTTDAIRKDSQKLAVEYMRPSEFLDHTDIEDPLSRDTSSSRFNTFVLDNLHKNPKIPHPSVKDPADPKRSRAFEGSEYAQALDDMINQYSRRMAEALYRVFGEDSLGYARAGDSVRLVTFKNSDIRYLYVEVDIPGKSRLLIGGEILDSLSREPLSVTVNGEIVKITPHEFFKNPDRFRNNPEIREIIIGRLESLIKDRIRNDLSEYMRIHGKFGVNNLVNLFSSSVPFKFVVHGEFDTVPKNASERSERIAGAVTIPSSRVGLDVNTTALSQLFYRLYRNYGRLVLGDSNQNQGTTSNSEINLGDLRGEYQTLRFAAPLIIARLAVRFKSGQLAIPEKYNQVAKFLEELVKQYESDPKSAGEAPVGFYKWVIDRCTADEQLRDSMVRLLLDLTIPGAIVESAGAVGPSLPPMLAFYIAPQAGGTKLLLQNDPSGRGLSAAIRESIRLSAPHQDGVRTDVLSNTEPSVLNFEGVEVTSLQATMRDHPVRARFFAKMAEIRGSNGSNAFVIESDGNIEQVRDRDLAAIMQNDTMASYLDGLVTLCEVVLKDEIMQPQQNPQSGSGGGRLVPPTQLSPDALLIPIPSGQNRVIRGVSFGYDVMTGWKQL